MYSRNLFVLDFARRFFVNCAQISEAYVDEIRVQLAENRPQRQVQKRLREYKTVYQYPWTRSWYSDGAIPTTFLNWALK